MPNPGGMQPSHWAQYLNQLAERLEKAQRIPKYGNGTVEGDPRALRDAAKAIEELDKQARAGTEVRRSFDVLSAKAAHARIDDLFAELQDGIDGGQRAKAELDTALGMQNNRLEALEDKAGSIGEWQESVDTQINEIYGRLLELEQEGVGVVREETNAQSNRIDQLQRELDRRLGELTTAVNQLIARAPDNPQSNAGRCNCGHSDGDFLTSLGLRICSYCGHAAKPEFQGPRDLKTRQF